MKNAVKVPASPSLTFTSLTVSKGLSVPVPCVVIVTSSLVSSCVSLAVKRKTYSPGTLKRTMVVKAFGLSKDNAPGPLTLLQVVVTMLPCGRPSSEARPCNVVEVALLASA